MTEGQAGGVTPHPSTPPSTPAGGAPSGLRQTAARGAGITLVVQLSRTILQFAAIVALARLLAPADFGLVAMVMAVIGIADLVRDFGLSLATMRAPSLSVAERSNLFWANLGFGLACTAGAMAAAPVIAWGYSEPRLTPLVLWLACVFTVSGFATQYRAGLARDLRYKSLGLMDLCAQLVGVIVAIALAVFGAGVWALVAQQISAAAAGAVLGVLFGRWWPGLPVRDVSIRGFLRFGGGVFGTQAISYLTKNVDNIALGASLGAGPLGFYDRAYQLMMMPLNQINAPMTNVAVPVLSRVQDDDAVFVSYLRKSQLVACYITATTFAVALGLAGPIVGVVFGSRWSAVTPIFAVLALGGMFRAVAQVAYWAYLARGHAGALLRQRLITGPVTIAMILAGLPWGPVGVAWGHSISTVFAWQFALWHVGRVTGLNTRPLMTNAVRVLLLVGLPSGAAAYAATFIAVPDAVQVLLGAGFAAASVAASAGLFTSVREDLRMTIGFAREAVSRRRAAGV